MPPRFAIWISAIFLIGILLLAAGFWGYEKLQSLGDLSSIENQIVEDFPEIEHISAATLAELQQAAGTDLLLIDCRTAEEFAISRIPGAVNLTTSKAVTEYLSDQGRSPDHIAIYCSVGHRSAELSTALTKIGVENVTNVRGSIFAWANEDRPLEKPNGSVATTVHPYSNFWAKLLKPGKASVSN